MLSTCGTIQVPGTKALSAVKQSIKSRVPEAVGRGGGIVDFKVKM